VCSFSPCDTIYFPHDHAPDSLPKNNNNNNKTTLSSLSWVLTHTWFHLVTDGFTLSHIWFHLYHNRRQLRSHIGDLQNDDQRILFEGLDRFVAALSTANEQEKKHTLQSIFLNKQCQRDYIDKFFLGGRWRKCLYP
jgi:hypothetical protein